MPNKSKQGGLAPPKPTTPQINSEAEVCAPVWDHESVEFVADALRHVGIKTRPSARDISSQVQQARVRALNVRDPSRGRRSLPIAIRAEERL